MRHRQILAATSAVLLLAIAPVQASDPVVVIGGPPPGWTSIHHDCGNKSGVASGGFLAPQFGPVFPGTGDGSVKIHAGNSDMEGFEKSYPTFGQLAEIGARVYEQDANSRFAFRITVDTGSGYRSLVWQPNPADGTFTDVSPFLNSTVWTIYDDNSIGSTFGTTTIEDYQAIHGARPFTFGIVSWGCTTTSTVYVDTTRVVVNGVEEYVDFEPQPTDLDIVRDKTSLTYGQQVVVDVYAHDMFGEPLVGNVRLVAKPGEHLPFEVGALSTDSNGFATLTHKPTFTTTFFWELEGGGVHAPGVSPERTVVVRSKVTASLVDSTVKKGERIKVNGKVAPDYNGLAVTLWRQTSTGRVKLGTTTTRPDSTFRVVSSTITTTNSANWKVYVSVPATEDNAPGKSTVMNVAIN